MNQHPRKPKTAPVKRYPVRTEGLTLGGSGTVTPRAPYLVKPVSVMLTPAEKAALRQHSKDASATFQKAFSKK